MVNNTTYQLLVKFTFDISSKNHILNFVVTGMTALLYAIKGDHWRCVESLLSAKACVNGLPVIPNGLPISPILTAISNHSLAALRVLLRANCATNRLGLLRADGDPILPIMLVAQQQEDVLHILQLFAIAECQVRRRARTCSIVVCSVACWVCILIIVGLNLCLDPL